MTQSDKCFFSFSLSDSLHQVLSEFGLVRPIRTDSEGRFLSASVSSHHLHRSKRHAHHPEDTPIEASPPSHSQMGWDYMSEETELFYNVTAFGQELHLRLRPNSHLVAPTATMEWEEGGHMHSQPIGNTSCFYTGQVSNMEDTSVAISNCDGLVGVTWSRPGVLLVQSFQSLVCKNSVTIQSVKTGHK